jgi:hypothetical protein
MESLAHACKNTAEDFFARLSNQDRQLLQKQR